MPAKNGAVKEKNIFGLTVLTNSHPDIKRLRKETGYPTIHGNKFWKSTNVLIDYLLEFPPPALRKRSNSRSSKRPLNILEIGCGWGIGGLFCAKQFSANLTSLDADPSVFPYLLHHARLNELTVTPWTCRYEKVRKLDLEKFDLVIGADICFWDDMAAPLYNLVKRASQVSTRVVITDPGRQPFQTMAEQCVDKLGATYERWSVPHPNNASGFVLDFDPQ